MCLRFKPTGLCVDLSYIAGFKIKYMTFSLSHCEYHFYARDRTHWRLDRKVFVLRVDPTKYFKYFKHILSVVKIKEISNVLLHFPKCIHYFNTESPLIFANFRRKL